MQKPSTHASAKSSARKASLRELPKVDKLLNTEPLGRLIESEGRAKTVAAVRQVLAELRQQWLTQKDEREIFPLPESEIVSRIVDRLAEGRRTRLKGVINATGILLHTGLGRAPLAETAIDAVGEVARDYANLEFDLASGGRSNRQQAVATALCELSGAQAALVVNNNAGATLLVLAALAPGREVIVSRGELIEIGGSFRLPEVMAAGGAVLREVGTTNKTRPDDYERAIHENTAALMQVHTSNYRVSGFTSAPSLSELARLARRFDLPLIHDIGSGALLDFQVYGFSGEPIAAESIRHGADLVLFSGDKLLGGPQCGVIVGGRNWIERVERHPMMRAMRVGKLTLAALSATLDLYLRGDAGREQIPLLRLLSIRLETLRERAERLAARLAELPAVALAEAVEDVTYLGGGSIPAQQIGTWCVALELRHQRADRLAKALRIGRPPVVGRIKQDRLRLDLRSVFPRQDDLIAEAVAALSFDP